MSRLPAVALSLVAMAAAACAGDQATAPPAANLEATHVAHSRQVEPTAELNRQLAELRAATARFHDIEAAREAGYVILFDPDGAGPGSACLAQADAAMGEHYVDPGLLFDQGALDVAAPEALIYEPAKNGRYRLVGVEYVIPFSDLPPTAPAPILFGQAFMPNHNPGFQLWALHVWAWRDNPDGIFAPYNPTVTCQYSSN